MEVGFKQAQELIFAALVSLGEETDLVDFFLIVHKLHHIGFGVPLPGQAVDKGANKPALMEQMNAVGRAVDISAVILLRTLGSYEVAEDGGQVENHKDNGTDHSQLVLAELMVHKAPLGGIIVLILFFRFGAAGGVFFFFQMKHSSLTPSDIPCGLWDPARPAECRK